MSETNDQVLSKRAVWTRDFPNFKREFAPKVRLNSYDPLKNITGIVDLGGAENKLCEDILLEKLRHIVNRDIDSSLLYYFEYHGIQRFRQAVASLLMERLDAKQTISPDSMIITSGVGAALDLLAHVLVDPGEAFLSPSPYYSRVNPDVGERSQAKVISVPLSHQDSFTLTVEKLDKAYKAASNEGTVVRGIILLNPHNPTGDIYSQQLLLDILNYAKSKQLHVVMDEVYAMSVFAEDKSFHSVAAMQSLPDPARTHLVWGFSKDFALSGFRVGVIHSWNSAVISSIKPLCYFAAVPAIVQDILCKLISDKVWLEKVYFPANFSRMKTNRQIVVHKVTEMGGVVHPSKGAFFVWADFTQVFSNIDNKPDPFDLFLKLFEAGVYVEPARAFYMEDCYWYRIIFTLPEHILKEGLTRMKDVLASYCDLTQFSLSMGDDLALNALELDLDLGEMEVISGASTSNSAAIAEGGGENLDGILRGLCMQIRSSDWLEKQQGRWESENPEAAAELQDLMAGKKSPMSLDDL